MTACLFRKEQAKLHHSGTAYHSQCDRSALLDHAMTEASYSLFALSKPAHHQFKSPGQTNSMPSVQDATIANTMYLRPKAVLGTSSTKHNSVYAKLESLSRLQLTLYDDDLPGIKSKTQAATRHVLKHQSQPFLLRTPVGHTIPPAVQGLALQHVGVAEQGSGLAQPLPVALLHGCHPSGKHSVNSLA